MKIRLKFIFLGVSVFTGFCLSQQSDSLSKTYEDVNFKKFYFNILPSDTVVSLGDKFILSGSLKVYSDSVEVSDANYDVDYRFGKIRFRKFFIDDIYSGSEPERTFIIITYKNLPYDIDDFYSGFELKQKTDTLSGDTVKIREIKKDFSEDLFSGSELQKSGSIFRGFTLGNNRDLSLQSGFRLQLNGKLSDDIDITAALTDENTPIQPEGNTQKLQELDKVFIELRSSNFTTTLGDIEVDFKSGDFFNFSRKLQGIKAAANFRNLDFFLSGALSRGRFNTNFFNGVDGVQGPYRLTGADNEINIIVLAGTEKVYLDGVLMTRGESNDYIIDYSNGQITFTSKRLITNASRITVDFEYSDKKYSRTFIAGYTKSILPGESIKLNISYLRERDDPSKPIDFTISDSDRAVISKAGDDKFKASKSGVTFAGRDSTGKPLGLYVKKDTLINSQNYTLYLYSPDSDSALYQVSFSYVGQGRGDYRSLSSFVYQFAGIGNGDYLPIVFFPLPVSYQSVDLNTEINVSKNLLLFIEGSLSDLDKNLLSGNDDTNNKGGAVSSSIIFSTGRLKIGKINLGESSLYVKGKYLNKLFSSAERLNKVEYDRIWDIQDSLQLTEVTNEAGFSIKPLDLLSLNASGGRIKRGSSFNSLRGSAECSFKGDYNGLPDLKYKADYISSRDLSLDYKAIWIRQKASAEFRYGSAKNKKNYAIVFDFSSEDKQSNSVSTDTSLPGSFRFRQFSPGVYVFDLFNFDLSYKLTYRTDDMNHFGIVMRQSRSFIHTAGIKYGHNFISSSVDLTIFERKYSEVFKTLGYGDLKTVLVSSQSGVWFFDRGLSSNFFYKVTSERTAKLETVFIKVPTGQGNYRYIGDLNGNGVQDENEFVLVNFDGDYIRIVRPTDQLFPTTDLQASVSLNILPSRIFRLKGKTFNELLKNITSDTYVAISEKNKDPKQSNVYLLRFSTFQNDSNTLNGVSNIQQDIGLFETNRFFGIRLRYIQRKGMIQYFSGNERFLTIDRTARLRLSFTDDLSLITDYTSSLSRNSAVSVAFRNWDINTKQLGSEMIYKPLISLETSFKLELKRAIDNNPSKATKADINSQIIRITYLLGSAGSLRAELSRNEVVLSGSPAFIPFELTKGLEPGRSFFWNLSLDYRITNFIQAILNYTGRAENKSRVIHTGSAEIRAYF